MLQDGVASSSLSAACGFVVVDEQVETMSALEAEKRPPRGPGVVTVTAARGLDVHSQQASRDGIVCTLIKPCGTACEAQICPTALTITR